MIFVTGGTGFLGAHLICSLLLQGERVKALRRESSDMSEFDYIFSLLTAAESTQNEMKQRLQWVIGDITDLPSLDEAMAGSDEVFHCAAIVSFDAKDRDLLMEVNAEGTANVVNLCLHHKVKLLHYVSSIAALGRAEEGQLINESATWTPSVNNSRYAISKHKAEMEVWRGVEEGLMVSVVNPGVILGAGNWHKGSCQLFNLPWRNFPFYTTGENGYVDVRDVVGAMLHLRILPATRNQRYVLIGANMNMKYFMHTCAGFMHRRKARFRVTPLMATLAPVVFGILALVQGKRPFITTETARTSIRSYHYDSNKIVRQTAFVFTPIDETLHYICTLYTQSHT